MLSVKKNDETQHALLLELDVVQSVVLDVPQLRHKAQPVYERHD
jgi:hypothetical protein